MPPEIAPPSLDPNNPYPDAPRNETIPNRFCNPTNILRVYVDELPGCRRETLEVLYYDEEGQMFWAPIPRVYAQQD
jgi:hypothetical protein